MAPIIAILAKVAVGAVADKVGTVALNQTKLEKAVEARIASDPRLKNDLNAEPLWASRTATGSVMAAIGVLLPYILPLIGIDIGSEEVMAILQAVAVIGFSGYAFAGRALNWSAPMWSRIGRWFS